MKLNLLQIETRRADLFTLLTVEVRRGLFDFQILRRDYIHYPTYPEEGMCDRTWHLFRITWFDAKPWLSSRWLDLYLFGRGWYFDRKKQLDESDLPF